MPEKVTIQMDKAFLDWFDTLAVKDNETTKLVAWWAYDKGKTFGYREGYDIGRRQGAEEAMNQHHGHDMGR